MTGPGPIREPRTGERSGGEPRTGERSADLTGARIVEPRTGERPLRRPRPPQRPAAPQIPSWFKRNALRIRWATWIGVALIALRLIAPRPDGWRRWSDAAAALSDVERARTAALMYYQSAQRQWPAPGRIGESPAGMVPFLAGEASFSRTRYRLMWEYAADTTTGARVIGVSVIGDDPQLALTMAQRAPDGMPYLVSGRRFVALLASSTGR